MSIKVLINIIVFIFLYVYLSMLNTSIAELKDELKRAEDMTDKLVEAQNQLLDYEQKGLVKNFFPANEE